MLGAEGSPNPGRNTPPQSPPVPGGEEEDAEQESSLSGTGLGQPLRLGAQDGR